MKNSMEVSEKIKNEIIIWPRNSISKISSKENESTTPELIEEKFGKEVDLIIDGGIGGIEPSTIVNCTNGEAEIVRQGKGILNDF